MIQRLKWNNVQKVLSTLPSTQEVLNKCSPWQYIFEHNILNSTPQRQNTTIFNISNHKIAYRTEKWQVQKILWCYSQFIREENAYVKGQTHLDTGHSKLFGCLLVVYWLSAFHTASKKGHFVPPQGRHLTVPSTEWGFNRHVLNPPGLYAFHSFPLQLFFSKGNKKATTIS